MSQLDNSGTPSGFKSKNKNLVQSLKNLNIFEELSNDDLFALAQISKLRNFKKGDFLIKEGDLDCKVDFLLSGSVTVYKDQKVFSVLNKQGDALDEIGAIDGKPRSATVVSNEPTSTISIDISIVDRMEREAKSHGKYLIFRHISKIIADRLRKMNVEVLSLSGKVKNLQDQKKELEKEFSRTGHIERRKWPRYRISFPVNAKVNNRNVRDISVKDLSLGGLLCLFSEKLDIKEKVEISMKLPAPDNNLKPVEVFFEARVVRVEIDRKKRERKHRETAFEFINMDNYSGALLQACLDLESSKGNAVKLV